MKTYASRSLSGVRLDRCRIALGREAEDKLVDEDKEVPSPREELEA